MERKTLRVVIYIFLLGAIVFFSTLSAIQSWKLSNAQDRETELSDSLKRAVGIVGSLRDSMADKDAELDRREGIITDLQSNLSRAEENYRRSRENNRRLEEANKRLEDIQHRIEEAEREGQGILEQLRGRIENLKGFVQAIPEVPGKTTGNSLP